MRKKVYLVVRHTYPCEYGDYVDLVGIFENADEAKKIVDSFEDDSCKIHEVELGATYRAVMVYEEDDNDIKADYDGISLGGYAE